MKKKVFYITAILAGATILTACSKDDLQNNTLDAANSEIRFTGAIKKQSEILAATRSETLPNPDDYIVLNENNTEFGTFYIWMDIENNYSYFQQYVIKHGEQGSLGVISENNSPGTPLNWKDKTSEHTFYAWTQPHVSNTESSITGGVKMIQFPSQFGEQNNTPTDNITSPQDITGTVTFGTNGETQLEQFIVTQKGPLTYNSWGQDVALYFERPISKITLEKVIHIDADGVPDENIMSCSLDFPNMYKTAIFKPANFGGNDDVLTGEDNSKGITWNWDKDNNDAESVYVLPFQFGNEGNIQNDPGFFIVTMGDKSYAGTLNSLQINGAHELKAGECMKLILTINDGGGVGIGYKIIDWGTSGNKELPQYRIPGVYNKDDAERLLEALQKAANSSGTYTFPKDVEDLIVETETEPNKTYEINLFTHIDWSSIGEGITEIKIPDNCTLKGNGYNIKLKEGDSSITITGKIKNLYVNGVKQPDTPEDNSGSEGTTQP